MTARTRRISHVAWWAIGTLLVFEAFARWVTRPEMLLKLEVSGYRVAFEHRRALAAKLSSTDLRNAFVVLGDSTAERGINVCTLGKSFGRVPAGLAVPSGGTRDAEQLL